MDTPEEIQLNRINFNEPILISSAKPNMRVGINMPKFPGKKPKMTILGSVEQEVIKPNFPFYKLMKYLSALNSLESLNSILLENLQDAYKDITASLPKKIIWKGENLVKFPAARAFITVQFMRFIEDKLNTSVTSIQIVELTLYVFQKIYAISVGMKNRIVTDMQTTISDLMCSLPVMYEIIEENNQLAESWARKSLEYLESLPVVNATDIAKRKFYMQIRLAIIYSKLGYTENAICWLKKVKEAYQNFYYEESEDMFGLMISGYQTVMRGLVSDCFETLLLGRDFGDFLEIFEKGLVCDVLSSKMTREEYQEIFAGSQKDIAEINGLVEQAKKNQAAQFLQVKHESKGFDLVKDMQFALPKNNIFLMFAENIVDDFIRESFKKNKVPYKIMGEKSSAKLFIVSIYDCSVQDLQKICQHISHLKNLEAVNVKKHSAANHSSLGLGCDEVNRISSLIANQRRPTTSRDEAAVTDTPPQKTIEKSTPQNILVEKPDNDEFSTDVDSDSVATSDESSTDVDGDSVVTSDDSSLDIDCAPTFTPVFTPVVTPVIKYHWESAGMFYYVNKESVVKPLSGSSLPDEVWFGYIAPWILEDKQFNPEFCRRLASGKLSHDCIRDITKELLTWNNQNLSKDHPYKFKIVILNHDERLYGWIEDCCKDSKGKMHYLVCFGFMGNHKTKFLPDPENIKRKFSKDSNPDSDKPEGDVILKRTFR